MSYPIISIKHDRKGRATDHRPALVEVVVSYERKRIYLSTGVKLCAKEWKDGNVTRRADAYDLQQQIDTVASHVRDVTARLWKAGTFSLESLKREVTTQKDDTKPKPMEWIARRIEERPTRESTKRQHRVAFKFWEEQELFKEWSDFNLSTIERYDALVRAKVGKSTLFDYHKRLKIYVNDAVKHGLLEKSPYAQFKLQRADDVMTIRYLTLDEVQQLKSAELSGPLAKVRDCWMYCFYTGIAYAELASLKKEDFVEENGHTYMMKHRQKTDAPIRVMLLDEAVALLNKYEWNLPVMTNEKYNYYLKIVATAAGIDKRLTSHMARHSFATWALKMGVPRDVIAVMLGHRGLREVDRYARRLQEDVDEQYLLLNAKASELTDKDK